MEISALLDNLRPLAGMLLLALIAAWAIWAIRTGFRNRRNQHSLRKKS
jgi:hypothetical protein